MYASNPGKYRHRVRIDHKVKARDPADGSVITVWAPFMVDVPAEVLTGAGREFRAANAQQAEIVARVNMRWFPGLTAQMRVVWDGNIWGILAPPERDATGRREWRVQCSEGVNDGR